MTTPRERDVLSRTLRDLRNAAGLTLAQVAERLDVTVRTISRYERGDIVPSVEVIRELADALRVKPAQRRQLARMALDVREGTESRLVLLRPGSGGAQRMQERVRRIEADSAHVGSFASTLVTGMLQTPEYMLRVFMSVGIGEAEATGAASARQGRLSQALESPTRGYTQLVTEGALTWNVGGAELMARQMEHIAELAVAAPHFRVGVIPMAAPSDLFPMSAAFDVYDARAVLMGTYTATALMTKPVDVQAYHRLFDDLTSLAVFGEEAVPLLERIADEYRSIG